MTNEKDLIVKSLTASGDHLYCGCSNGVFVVLNMTRLKNNCSSINAKAFDADAFQKTQNGLFASDCYIGNIVQVQEGDVLKNFAQKPSALSLCGRTFNAIHVSVPSTAECDFF